MNGQEKLTYTLFEIANALNTAENLDDLYASIHDSLNEVIDATNFYIALYDRDEDRISFPYCVDIADGRYDDIPSASRSSSLTSKVIQSGRPFFSNKDEMIDRAARMNLTVVGTPAQQWLGVPLKTKGDIIGALVVQSYDQHDIYQEEDVALLVAVSDQVALAVERKRSEDAEAKSKAVNKILFSISNAVNTTVDLPDLYRSIHRSLGRIIDLTNFIIGLWNRKTNTITFAYYVDQFDNLQGRSMALDKGSVGRDVILSGKPVFLKEKALNKRILKNQAVGTWPKIWMGVPLKVEAEVIGYMAAQSFDSPDAFSEDDLEILMSVSEQIALAIDRKRSHEDLIESEKLTQALLKISNAVNTAEDLSGLYCSIHHALKGVIDVTNFAIGIYDTPKDLMSYPYYIDETGDVYQEIENASTSNILAGEVIKHKKPVFVSKEEMIHRAEENQLVGNASEQWLGVPLRVKDEVIGVIVVQSYDDPDRYRQKDADVLLSVSDQIALAIDRKRAQEEIKQSEKRTQALFNIANAVNTTDNMDDLYVSIYNSLNRIIPLPNFLICVVDEEKELLHFPFFIDEHDTGDSVPVTLTFREAANTITAEVINTRQARFYTDQMIKERAKREK
ncbi:MAG: GAF domain-containing protein, partial [Desulfobacterales bacterium]|nr:GAF domain-containing protein [Desulfobacterales bacterium]